MRSKVTEHWVIIPKRLLRGVVEVDIQQQNGVIVVEPVSSRDPVYELGSAPIDSLEIRDASTHHDRYVY